MNVRFALSIGLMLTASAAHAAAFKDISNAYSRNAIEYLQEKGIINGYPDGTFRPAAPVNRAELLKMLVISKEENPLIAQYHGCFSDVSVEWFAPYVCYAKQEGWVTGYPDGSFRPGQTVKTEEAMKMLIESYGYRTNQSSSVAAYADADPSAWYAPYLSIVKQMSIVDAPDNSIGIGMPMTRGSVSDMMYRGVLARKQGNAFRGGRFRAIIGGGNAPAPVITFNDISKTYGDAIFTVQALSNSLGHIVYTSGNTGVATINGSTVTIVGAGTTTITASQVASGRFAAGSATATLTVNGIAPSITFSNLTKSHIDANFTLSPISDSPGAFTFTSGNPSLVSITGNTADIVGTNGTMTITAHQAASGNYAAATKTMNVTVFATYCVSEPCLNSATCVPTLGGNGSDNFVCECVDDHYAGVYCEESDLNCQENGGALFCNNGGSCVKDVDGGVCDCAGGFCGTYCEILPSQCGD